MNIEPLKKNISTATNFIFSVVAVTISGLIIDTFQKKNIVLFILSILFLFILFSIYYFIQNQDKLNKLLDNKGFKRFNIWLREKRIIKGRIPREVVYEYEDNGEKEKEIIFKGLGEPGIIWPRYKEEKDICTYLCNEINDQNKPIILCGSSGVGKSTLVKEMVQNINRILEKKDEEKFEIIQLSNYDNLFDELDRKFRKNKNIYPDYYNRKKFIDDGNIDNIANKFNLLFVFDQFEQFIAEYPRIKDEPKRKLIDDFLKNSINKARYVIVVRKEWYWNLRNYFKEELDIYYVDLSLMGFQLDRNISSDREDILRDLQKANNGGEAVAKKILVDISKSDEILPIEIQVVGFMLGNKSEELGRVLEINDYNELGKKEGLIKHFFHAYLDSSPNRYISSKVLAALSMETRFRERLKIKQIADIIHEPLTDVALCAEFLLENNIIFSDKGKIIPKNIKQMAEYKIALVHDFLAEKFSNLSGSELVPAERDNILFFLNKIRSKARDFKITHRSIYTSKTFLKCMAFATIVLLLRLFIPYFNLPEWALFNPIKEYSSQSSGIVDYFYLPVFITHFLWATYVSLLYSNLFVNLKRSIRGHRLLSIITVFVNNACYLLSVFWPFCWILSIGIGGVMVALWFYRLSKLNNLPPTSRAFFNYIGTAAVSYGAILIVFGSLLVVIMKYVNLSDEIMFGFNISNYLYIFNYVTATLMIPFAFGQLFNRASRNASSKMIGLIDRAEHLVDKDSILISRAF